MPVVTFLDGVKIEMYFDDHAPPHVQANYAEYEALLIIADGSIYRGSLPGKQLKKVQDYILDPVHNKQLIKRWKQYNRA